MIIDSMSILHCYGSSSSHLPISQTYNTHQDMSCGKLHYTSINHLNYFQTSNGHVTCIIKKVYSIPMHCGVAYESGHSLTTDHMIRVWYCMWHLIENILWRVQQPILYYLWYSLANITYYWLFLRNNLVCFNHI